MTFNPILDELEVRRLAEASVWRVRLAEAGAESSLAFEAWLQSDPANADAWSQVQEPWRTVGDASTSPELMTARAAALRRARRHSRKRWAGPKALPRAAAGLAAVVVAGGLLWVGGGLSPAQTYRTALGERRVVTLVDGSRLSLDSSTVVKVRYSHAARRLELLAGQARFDVAHNSRRPFTVTAGDQTVVATGTAFNIDLVGRRVMVTLIQGHVTVVHAQPRGLFKAVLPAAPAHPSISLNPGQELVSAPALAPKVEVASLDRTTAWESGQLIFQDEPLATVVERVSRYSAHPITVDPAIAGLRISGVFNAGDSATFVDAVTRYLPVQATETPDGDVALHKRG